MNSIKYLSILFFVLYISTSTVDSFVNHWEVHIVNTLPNDDIPLWYHCASGNHNFGYDILRVGQDFHFDFKVNYPWKTTLFFCHFWWGEKENSFDVFSKGLMKHICSNVRDKIHSCFWKIQEDGFFAGPRLDKVKFMHLWF